MRLVAAISMILAGVPAGAQTPEEAAAMNMQLALETCMRHQRQETALPAALEEAGFNVSSGLDEGTFEIEAPGIQGYVGGETGSGYCTIQSGLVPLELAEAIGTAVGERLFPGHVTPGSPESSADAPPAPCEGFTIWEAQPVIAVSYAQAGNSGECVNDGTSAIILRM